MEEDPLEGTIQPKEILSQNEIIPDDLYSMYMDNRKSMGTCEDMHSLFIKLINSIGLGKEMLSTDEDNTYDALRERAETELSKVGLYPGKRRVELDSKTKYKLATSDKKTGYIYVRPEEIRIGIREVMNQQVSGDISTLSKLDREIFNGLINDGLITIKRPTLDDMFEMFLQGMFDTFEVLKSKKELKEVETGEEEEH